VKKRVCDAHALIAYFEKEEGWQKVTEYFQQAGASRMPLLLSTVNYGEVFYITLREAGRAAAEEVLSAIKSLPIQLVPVDEEIALAAAEFKAKGGLSYADCFAAGLAVVAKAEVITGDPEFKRIQKDVRIAWIKHV